MTKDCKTCINGENRGCTAGILPNGECAGWKPTFKIGDEIIMTADSGKGEIGYPNGEYKGRISHIVTEGLYITLEDSAFWFFCLDGSCITHPGMSIRPAEISAKIKVKKFVPKIDISDYFEPIEDAPSQWIEGQIPDSYEGIYYSLSHIKAVSLRHKNGNIKTTHILKGDWAGEEIAYILCPLPVLPPPPPAADVEAYGYLVYVDYIIKTYGDTHCAWEYITNARVFYFQPATAGVLENCFAGNCAELHYEATIDEYIAYAKASGNKLLFTPAALEELGVR